MKKKSIGRLALKRETLQTLDPRHIHGGDDSTPYTGAGGGGGGGTGTCNTCNTCNNTCRTCNTQCGQDTCGCSQALTCTGNPVTIILTTIV
jgi:hypothetical protein